MGIWLLFMIMNISLLTACGSKEDASDTTTEDGEKVFYYGDTTFNAENDESDVNPHNGYESEPISNTLTFLKYSLSSITFPASICLNKLKLLKSILLYPLDNFLTYRTTFFVK